MTDELTESAKRAEKWIKDVLLGGSDPSIQTLGVRKPDYSQPPRDDGTEYLVTRSQDLTSHLGSPVEPVKDDAAEAQANLSDDPAKRYVGQELDPKAQELLVRPKEENKGNILASKDAKSVNSAVASQTTPAPSV